MQKPNSKGFTTLGGLEASEDLVKSLPTLDNSSKTRVATQPYSAAESPTVLPSTVPSHAVLPCAVPPCNTITDAF